MDINNEPYKFVGHSFYKNGIIVQGLLVWSITNKRQLSRPIRDYLKSITFIDVESNSFYFDKLRMKVKAYGVNEVLNTAYHIVNFYKEFEKIWFCFMVFVILKAYRNAVTYLPHCACKHKRRHSEWLWHIDVYLLIFNILLFHFDIYSSGDK